MLLKTRKFCKMMYHIQMKWRGVYTQNIIDKLKMVNDVLEFQKSYMNQICFNSFLFKKYEGFLDEMAKIKWTRDNPIIG